MIAGSHNQGFKSLLLFVVLSGISKVAEAYTAHVLDVVNHYDWRCRLVRDKQEKKTTKLVKLDELDPCFGPCARHVL